MSRYLEALEPIVSPQQFAEVKSLVKAFLEEEGPQIQLNLQERRMKERNWVYDWWIHDMYLNNPAPLPINSNPGAVWPPQKFASVDDQLVFAAKLTTFFLDIKDSLVKNEYPIERATSREPGQPFCMNQFYKLLSSYRVPGIPCDTLRDTSSTFVDHIAVAYKNNFYSCPIRVVDRRLTTKEIFNQLKYIVTNGANETPNREPIAILTSQSRPAWADARTKLLALDDVNKQSIDEIETCHFIICLEDGLPTSFNSQIGWIQSGYNVNGRDDTNLAAQSFHGGGSRFFAGQRWYDKTVQFLVASDGFCGLSYEHSPAEGISILNLTDEFFSRLQKGPWDLEDPPLENVNPPPPIKLEWVLSEEIKDSIREASVNFDRLIADTDIVIYRYDKYGKGFIKTCKISPDVFIQLALQLAYFNIHGKMTATYESASTRRFKYGRVDCIRTNSMEVKDWVTTMLSAKADPETKVKKLRAAVDKHTEIMIENIMGEGIDIHLLGIREQAKELGIPVKLLEHETFKIANHFALSTSQVPTKCDQFMGYGAVVPDGYGVSYNPKEGSIVFVCGSFRSCRDTSTEKFLKSLTYSLDSIFSIFQA